MARTVQDKRLTDALRRALMRTVEIADGDEKKEAVAVDAIAQALILRAISGDVTAIREVYDRVEGKPKQAIEADVNANISLVDALIAAAAKEKEE